MDKLAASPQLLGNVDNPDGLPTNSTAKKRLSRG
jgi:hypothetical protein